MTNPIQMNPLLFEAGDRLSLDEFLELWEQMPGLKFAELIDGVVYMPSPVSYQHGMRDMQLHVLLGTYGMRTGMCEAIANATWLMLGSAPQPDIALRLLPEFGGKSRISGKLLTGPAELAAEVSHASRSFDLRPKLDLYRKTGVTEYLVVLLDEQRLEWRVLEGQSYRPIHSNASGVLKSIVFPGLWINEPAYWENDAGAMITTLEDGLQSDECREFLRRKS